MYWYVQKRLRFNVCVFFFFKQKTAYVIWYGLVGSEMCIRDSFQSDRFFYVAALLRGDGLYVALDDLAEGRLLGFCTANKLAAIHIAFDSSRPSFGVCLARKGLYFVRVAATQDTSLPASYVPVSYTHPTLPTISPV